jgi:hypothetical protein
MPSVAVSAHHLPAIANLRRSAARIFLVLIGGGAIVWGASTLPMFWQQSKLERVAGYLMNRAAFKPGALDPLIPQVEAVEGSEICRPAGLRSAAIIRLRLAEEAMAAGARREIDGRLSALQASIRKSLACAPSDPFLWMVMAWLDGATGGFRPVQLQYLRLSYRFGPNEGWVVARRVRFALSTFERLPPDLAEAATNEFARMVDGWVYPDSVALFTGPGWPIHDRLLASLKNVGELQREAFAKALYKQGYDVAVPGITAPEPRPWR